MGSLHIDKKLLKHVTIEKATMVFDGATALCNRWWIVDDGCILFYRGRAPQCNSQKEIAEAIRDRLYPNAEVRFLPVVYRRQETY